MIFMLLRSGCRRPRHRATAALVMSHRNMHTKIRTMTCLHPWPVVICGDRPAATRRLVALHRHGGSAEMHDDANPLQVLTLTTTSISG